MKSLQAHGWWVLVAGMVVAGAIAMTGGESARADVRRSHPSPRLRASSAPMASHVRPSDLRPSDLRPSDIRPNDIRPSDDQQPSSVIFPHRSMPIRFDHALHAKLGATCIDCHTNARTSRRASERVVTSAQACDRCHGTRHDDLARVLPGAGRKGQCATCHEGYRKQDGHRVRRVRIPSPRLRFNHQAHAARNIGCGHCHDPVRSSGEGAGPALPTMQACLTCHDLPDDSRGDAKGACSTCHLTRPSGEMRTQYPEGQLSPPRWMHGARHGPDFVHTHGRIAADNSQFCANCHREDECVRCHDGRVRPRRVHPNDFLSMHGLAAKQSAQRCGSCHREASFCKPCHMRSGVTATGPSWRRSHPGRIHPPPEVFVYGPVTSQHHATEARRNLTACVGCHVERDCVGCHATRGGGGVGVNPHPAGFSSRCRSAWTRNPRPCLVCHDPGDAELSRCR